MMKKTKKQPFACFEHMFWSTPYAVICLFQPPGHTIFKQSVLFIGIYVLMINKLKSSQLKYLSKNIYSSWESS